METAFKKTNADHPHRIEMGTYGPKGPRRKGHRRTASRWLLNKKDGLSRAALRSAISTRKENGIDQ